MVTPGPLLPQEGGGRAGALTPRGSLGECWAILRTSGCRWLDLDTCFLFVFIFTQLEMTHLVLFFLMFFGP